MPTPDTVTFTTTATALPTTAGVAVGNNFFNPNSVTIAVGGTVTWTWNVANTHNVTFANVAGAPANIPNTNTGMVSRTFTTAGVFNYECTLHNGMTAVVNVQ